MDSMTVSQLIANQEIQKAIAESRSLLRRALPAGTFAGREGAALAATNEVVRSLLEEELQELAGGFGEEIVVEGVTYRQHEPGTVMVHSLCGPLTVSRYSYRQVGIHNGPTVVALDLEAGLIERATPAMAFNVAHGFAQHDMRVHEEGLRAAHRTPPSRTTLERMANRIAEAVVEEAPRIERQLRRGETVVLATWLIHRHAAQRYSW